MQIKQKHAVVAALVATCIFSAHYVVAKIVLESLTAPELASTRGAVGGLVLALVYRKKLQEHLTLKWLPVLAGIGGLGFCANQLLLFQGLARTTPANAAFLSSMIPIVSTVLAMATGVEAWSPKRLAGVALGVGAVGWYLFRLGSLELEGHLAGNLLVLGNVLCFSLALLLIRKFCSSLPPEVVTSTMLILGGAGLWLYGGNTERVAAFALSSPNSLALLVFEAVVTTAIAYSLNVFSLQRLNVASTTVFNYLQIPLTAGISWAVFGAAPPWELGVAFGGILVACMLVLSENQA